MWQYIRRGLRAPFDRGAWSNRTGPADQGNNLTQENSVKKQLPCPFRIVPCILESWQRHIAYFGTQPHKEKQSSDKHSNDSTKGPFENNVGYQPCCTLLGAVGWSGVLVLGWSILQPWYRHSQRRSYARQELRSARIQKSNRQYSGLYNLLIHPALTQPVNYIPQVQSDQISVVPSQPYIQNQHEDVHLSPEEKAFEEAAEQVRLVHERVVGEAENRRGVMCLSHSMHQEAIEHFRVASSLKNAPAAFNLGQCYEMGVGIEQDYTQAAHWYKLASDLGHPTAMYNLGVFHAQGWGGLDVDTKQARQLFLTAAALGQPEAQAALNIERKSLKSDTAETESKIAVEFFKINNLNLFKTSKKESRNERLQRPDSSLPNTPSPSASSSSSVSSTEDSLDIFSHTHAQLSSDGSRSEIYSDSSSEDEWQLTANVASEMNGNSATLYRLALCYENSHAAERDPELVLQLYRMAADHGHEKARRRLRILEQHNALGTMTSFLRNNRKKTKPSSITECVFHQ